MTEKQWLAYQSKKAMRALLCKKISKDEYAECEFTGRMCLSDGLLWRIPMRGKPYVIRAVEV